jgi:hypothetical protein
MSIDVDYITESKTLSDDFNVFLADATNTSLTLTLPLFVADGEKFQIKRIESTILKTVSIIPTSPQTIYGGNISFAVAGSCNLVSYGSSWYNIN